jgi:hypothetical protein
VKLDGKVISNVETERLREKNVVACCKVTATNYFDRLRKAMKNTHSRQPGRDSKQYKLAVNSTPVFYIFIS